MTRAHYATADSIRSQGPGDSYADIGHAPEPKEDKAGLKARAILQRSRLIETEKRATSCAPTMRTIRLCDNSAYDSNCPAVWKHALDMGCVVR